jgi:negative regulator of flagellin synthesis FlgM
MMIDRVGPVDPLKNAQAGNRGHRAEKAQRGDSISLSSEAQELGDLYRAAELVKAVPDVRADKVAELKAKIDDPSYIDDAVLSVVSDRILDQFGF